MPDKETEQEQKTAAGDPFARAHAVAEEQRAAPPPPAAEPEAEPEAAPAEESDFDFAALEKLAAEEDFGDFVEEPKSKKGKKAEPPDDDVDLRGELQRLRAQQEHQARLFEQTLGAIQQGSQQAGGPDLSKLTPEQRAIYEMRSELESLRQQSHQAQVQAQVREFERQIDSTLGATEPIARNQALRRLADGYMRARLARGKDVTPAQAAREVVEIVGQIQREAVNGFIAKAKARSSRKTTGAGGGSASSLAAQGKKFSRQDWDKGNISKSLGETLARMLGRA